MHCAAELGSGRLGCLLRLGQPLPGLPGLGQQPLIHTATVARQRSPQDTPEAERAWAHSTEFQKVVRMLAVVSGASTAGECAAAGMQTR